MEQKKGLRKLGSNIIIFTIGSFASKMMNYFLLPFYTSILTQAEYGVYDIVATTSNLLYPFTTLLITEATMRFTLDREYDRKKVFTLSVVVTGIGFLVFVICSPLILLSQAYKAYYIHFLLYHFFVTLHTLVAQYSKGIEETKKYALSGIIGTAVTITSNILLMVYWDFGLEGYFVSYYIGAFASSIYLFVGCKIWKYILGIGKRDYVLLKEMLKYSLPIMPNAISWWISTSSDKYLIGYFVGVNAVGLYSIAYKIPSLMTVFTTIFFNAWQITAVEDFGTPIASKRYSQVYNWLFSIIFALSSVIILMSKIITKILFSEAFFDAWRYIPFLVAAYVFHDLSAYIGSIYTAAKKTEMLFVSTLIGAGVNLILNIFFIAKWGAIGAAITTLISYFVVWLIRLFDTKKLMVIEYAVKKNIISIVLLMIEMIIIFSDFKYSIMFGIISVILILFINRYGLLNILENLLKKKQR